MSEQCLFDPIDGGWKCITCGRTVRLKSVKPPAANCRLVGPPPRREPVGTMLAGLIAWFGIRPGSNCKCEERKRELDRRGADWAEANIDTIVGWLREAHAEQGIVIPFIEPAARLLVQRAVTQAKTQETGIDAPPQRGRIDPSQE